MYCPQQVFRRGNIQEMVSPSIGLIVVRDLRNTFSVAALAHKLDIDQKDLRDLSDSLEHRRIHAE